MCWLKSFIAVAVIALGSAVQAQDPSCRDPARPMLRAELMFGRTIGGRLGVNERQWQRFLKDEMTPRFADGLTVVDGRGQWRNPGNGAIVREHSKVVIILVADTPAARERIDAVTASYKLRFKQKSVGVVTHTVCAAF